MRTHHGRLGRLARRARRGARAVRATTACSWSRSPSAAREVERLLRGLLQRHAVAALPRRRSSRPSSTGSGGTPTSRSTSASPTRPPRSPSPGAVVWVQDYQLQLVPQMLRELRPDLRIGFFLHIPFPPTELYQQLPWRNQILRGPAGRRPGRIPAARRRAELRPAGPAAAAPGDPPRPDPRPPTAARCWPGRTRSRSTRRSLHDLAASPEAAERGRGDPARPGRPEVRSSSASTGSTTPRACWSGSGRSASWSPRATIDPDEAVFVQVATPSRERVDQYRQLRDDIDRLVGRINGDIGRIGRPPITYLHTSYPREEMAALYRAADIMVVTPLRDGMNLVAKEFVACRQADDGRPGAERVRRRGQGAAPGLPGQPARHQRAQGAAGARP